MHKPPKETELEEWAAETFKVQRDKNGAELFRDLTKTAYVTLHYPPVFRELFLQTERHYLDGRGIMRFRERFFREGGRPPGPRREAAWARQGGRAGHAGAPFLGRADLGVGQRQRLARPELQRGAEVQRPRHVRHPAGVQAQGVHRDGGMARGGMADTTPAVTSLGNADPYLRRRYGAAWEVEGMLFGDTVTGPWLEGFSGHGGTASSSAAATTRAFTRRATSRPSTRGSRRL
ncbi:hypothetical protein DL766_004413 [Monosporascus sp. MC13-8B]|nr:hypothetical protein DL766_004413 [Monosporascus sp. MC13-8B]